jgi:hypothetical protein
MPAAVIITVNPAIFRRSEYVSGGKNIVQRGQKTGWQIGYVSQCIQIP